MDITIRPIGPDPDDAALRLFQRPLDYAFLEKADETEFAVYKDLVEPERFINAFDGETPVGSAGAYTFRLTLPGNVDIGAAGITAVGVMASHRRRGILRQMLTWLLDQALERGEPVAVLQASEAAIYRRFGFGHASLSSKFELERSRATFLAPVDIDAIGQVRFVDIDEGMELIPPMYDSVRLRTPATLDRSPEDWRHLILGAEPWNKDQGMKYRAVLQGSDGAVRAYAAFWIKGDWSDRGPNARMSVNEVIGTDPEAEQAMWQWLCGYDLVGVISTWRGQVPHPLQLWLTEPRRMGLVVKDNIFLRFLDLPVALGGARVHGLRRARPRGGGPDVRGQRWPLASVDR